VKRVISTVSRGNQAAVGRCFEDQDIFGREPIPMIGHP
jgi:hypothetical protein